MESQRLPTNTLAYNGPYGYLQQNGSSVGPTNGVPAPPPAVPTSAPSGTLSNAEIVAAFDPYGQLPPQGYLDSRPTYDDHTPYGTAHFIPQPMPQGIYTNGDAAQQLLLMGAYVPPHGPPPPPPVRTHTDFNLPPPPPPRPPEPVEQIIGPDGNPIDVRWRDPDLHEVIDFLSHANPIVRANAAAYLQHLCFMDDEMKQKTRSLGGIPALINLLSHAVFEVQRNALGALRNLSFGRKNDENKRAIRDANGINALVQLLRKTGPNTELRELATGILWNLSSCEDLKRAIIDEALQVLVSLIIIPQSGWGTGLPQAIYWSVEFRNASGILRNVSSAGEYSRKKLRECDGLVDSLLYIVRTAVAKNDTDNKCVENCVCILRNLSYRCQEVVDPDYDKNYFPSQDLTTNGSKTGLTLMGNLSNKVIGDNLSCFGVSSRRQKNHSKLESSSTPSTTSTSTTSPNDINAKIAALNIQPNNGPSSPPSSNGTIRSPRSSDGPVRGMEALWQPDVVQPYLALLSECSNPETLEAAAGAIQNLTACYWQPSIDIRAAVRKEKGLPVLVELLRMEVDRVVCAVATALRNLAIDTRNKELIGKYAMRDLVSKLPSGNPAYDNSASDDTLAAVLATLNEVISKNVDFARSLLEANGVDRLQYIIKNKPRFSNRVYKFTSQLLLNMWAHSELREAYRKAGFKECHFIVRNQGKGSISAPSSPPPINNSTLSRPMSSQGPTKYEDRSLPRGATMRSHSNSINNGVKQSAPRTEDHQVNGGMPPPPHPMGTESATQLMSPIPPGRPPVPHRPPVGGVSIFPPGATNSSPNEQTTSPVASTMPFYSRIIREKKNPPSSSTSAISPPQNALNSNSQPTYANGSHEFLLNSQSSDSNNDRFGSGSYDRDNAFADEDDGISNPLIGMCLQQATTSSDTSSQTALINHQHTTDHDHYSFILETHEPLQHPLNVPAGDSWV